MTELMCGDDNGMPTYVVNDPCHVTVDGREQKLKGYILEVLCTGASWYLLGAILFLTGSIFFYPKYADVNGTTIGAWLFEFGCVFFTMGSAQYVYHQWHSCSGRRHHDEVHINRPSVYPTIRTSKCSHHHYSSSSASVTPVTKARLSQVDNSNALSSNNKVNIFKLIPLILAIDYLIGSVIFVIGAIYFYPKYYAIDPSLGCYMFIVGCCLFCGGSIGDVTMLSMSNSNANDHTMRLKNLKVAPIFVAVTNFIGCTLFIIGCEYFLPEYLVDDDAIAFSVDFFVIGSVFFILSALTSVFILHTDYTEEGQQDIV